MKTREFSPEDFYFVNLWLAQREMAPIQVSELPKRGWTVIDDLDKPLGIVFLRMVEGDLAIIDSMINDPSQTKMDRHKINERLFLQCKKIARELKLKGLMGSSLDEGTLKRASTHGFIPSSQTFVTWTNKEN